MSSVIYHSCLYDALTGAINFLSDSFHAVLVTNAYVPNKHTHAKRSDITNEVTGVGYSSGGVVVTATPVIDHANDLVAVTFSNPSWPVSTITARGVVICKWRGGAASADELVAYVDFGIDVVTNAETFVATLQDSLDFKNPD